MYRGRRRRCPACAAPMDEVPVDAGPGDDARAEIDRCASCGGLFLEFFDGEPSALSRRLGGRDDVTAATDATDEAAPSGTLTCPDCAAAMVERPYLGHGPALPRCETCLAVFLTPAMREALAQLTLPPDEQEAEPGWLDRALEWLKGLG